MSRNIMSSLSIGPKIVKEIKSHTIYQVSSFVIFTNCTTKYMDDIALYTQSVGWYNNIATVG